MDVLRRRTLLACVGAALATPRFALSKAATCSNFELLRDVEAPLTIDVHAHIFNGSDLQIAAFLTKVVDADDHSELHSVVKVLGGMLQRIAWRRAPTGAEELRRLDGYRQMDLRCQTTEQYRSATKAAAQDGYSRGLEQLRVASNQAVGSGNSNVLSTGRLRNPVLQDAINRLPSSYEDYRRQRDEGSGILATHPTLFGYLDFVLHHFNYRHVNAYDYFQTYDKDSPRKIDLLVACMVDYDYWLAKGEASRTPLDTQVTIMGRISELTGGRVHGFVPFCPFRETMTRRGNEPGESLKLVQRAILQEGFLGVKLYPPMGFAAWGNSQQTVWKTDLDLLADARKADFGGRLDDAMRSLFEWCISRDVPVMAHSNVSNGPNKPFRDLAGSTHWRDALKEFKGLRISFGHLGDSDFESDTDQRPQGFIDLMKSVGDQDRKKVYGDSAYFAGVLVNADAVTDSLAALYSADASGTLVERLMYGTDWTMILPEKNVEAYLQQFIGVYAELERRKVTNVHGLSLGNAFFGGNAASYLGLRPKEETRKRLEEFYAKRKIAAPDWMQKLS